MKDLAEKSGGVDVNACCYIRLETASHRIGASVQTVNRARPKPTAQLANSWRRRRAILGRGLSTTGPQQADIEDGEDQTGEEHDVSDRSAVADMEEVEGLPIGQIVQ